MRLPNLNKVLLSGRITNDVELKHTPSGTSVTKFTLAVNKSSKDAQGNWQNVASFLDVVAWDKLAERISAGCKKGSPVIVEGRIEARSYVDKDKNNRKAVEIVADHVQILESAQDDQLPSVQNTQTDTVSDDMPF
jgi:single-strand DNA-binding protein